MAFPLPASCAIVCHDAGAANLIFAWLAADAAGRHRIFAAGPAARLPMPASAVACGSIDESLQGASLLLSGTGWASDVEHEARRKASAAGLRTIAVLDHWANYRERFVRNGETVLPDEFWVTDPEALQLAQTMFPGATITLQPNLYVDQLVRQIAEEGAPDPAEVLFLLEPLRNGFGRGVAGEFQALDYFVSAVPRLGLPDPIRLRLRPHPSDPQGKYDAWVRAHAALRAECTPASETLAQAIGRAGLVVGCHSQALVFALQAGRRVLCALPPWAPPCALPFAGIETLAPR